MGSDRQPKVRQLDRGDLKKGRQGSYSRILIVSEGSKTEPLYFREIRAAYRLHSANVEVQPSQLGTAPIQVVNYARQLFEGGDLHRGIRPKSFDQVFAVFDRDDHGSYFEALNLATFLNGQLINDERQSVSFRAIASVPCFELWLLLHFEEIAHPLHRNEVMQRLGRHIPGYAKGASGAFASTRDRMESAVQRARALAARFSACTDPEPFTEIHDLVWLLITLRG